MMNFNDTELETIRGDGTLRHPDKSSVKKSYISSIFNPMEHIDISIIIPISQHVKRCITRWLNFTKRICAG